MSLENSIRVVQEWYNETSKTALQDALAEERYYGERDGEKRGKKQGLMLGKKQGIKQTRLETAKEILKDNIAIDTIIKYTKLPKSEILALVK